MSTELHHVLRERAERADLVPAADAQAVVVVVRERAEQRQRTRRNLAGGAAGAGLVAALIAGALVLPSSGHHPDGAPAGGLGGTTATPASGTAVGSAARASAQAARRAAALAAASAAAAQRRSAAAAAAAKAGGLSAVTTPAAAAVAIGLVPAGWHYVGRQGPVTFYGPAAMGPTIDQPDYRTVIVVDVHERVDSDDSSYPLTTAGRRTRYGTDDGVTIVSAVVDPTTELDVQLPVTAAVTRAQALRIAGSLELRSKAEKTHG